MDNQVQGTEHNVRRTESRNENEEQVDDNGGSVTRDRPEDNVFKASGARSEQAKQVEDDKGEAPSFDIFIFAKIAAPSIYTFVL
jgi:hypothetical protein